MARLRVHTAMSKRRTGQSYEELHIWIDEPRQWLRADHRVERHSYSRAMKAYVERRWGKLAVVEWLLHIAVDNLDTALKFARGTASGQRNGLVLKFKPGRSITWSLRNE